MKKGKRKVESYKKMDASQMKKIIGGYYVYITNPDGTITRVQI